MFKIWEIFILRFSVPKHTVYGIIIPCLILTGLSFLLFSNTFDNGWTYDDFPVIVENSDVRSLSGFLENRYPGRPIRELTFLLDYSLFGYEPFGWHIQQIIWHALNACLVFQLAITLRFERFVAWLAAIIFLCHPLQVEVVANISHRKDSLVLAGVLATLLVYRNALNTRGWRQVLLFLIVVFLSVLAFCAKQTAVVIPVVLLCYEIFVIEKPKRFLYRVPEVTWSLLAIIVACSSFWYVAMGGYQKHLASMPVILASKANYFGDISFFIYYSTVIKAWGFVFLKFFIPVDLAPEYIFSVSDSFFDPSIILSGILLIAICIFLFVLWRNSKTGLFLLFSSIFLFLPTSNIWPLVYLSADRYLYAPMAFLSILVAYGIGRINWHSQLKYIFAAAILVTLSILTWQQNNIWQSPKTLWSHAYKINPDSAFVLNNVGNLALLEQNFDKAKEYYLQSIKVNRTNPTAYYNLGLIAESNWKMKEALAYYRAFAETKSPQFNKALQELRERLKVRYGIEL